MNLSRMAYVKSRSRHSFPDIIINQVLPHRERSIQVSEHCIVAKSLSQGLFQLIEAHQSSNEATPYGTLVLAELGVREFSGVCSVASESIAPVSGNVAENQAGTYPYSMGSKGGSLPEFLLILLPEQ